MSKTVQSRLPTFAAALAALVCAALVLPLASAHASRTQFTIMQDDPQIVYHGANVRARRIAELRSLGVTVLKMRVSWQALAPGGRHVPRRFDASNPASYRRSVWIDFDDAIRRAQAAGMQVYLEIGGDAPYWATHVGRGRHARVVPPNGTYFSRFAEAVGTRYSGNYAGLPRVTVWGVWNEPNLAPWITPQYRGNLPVSPIVYRSMIYAVYSGLQRSGHAQDTFLFGELLPFARTSSDKSKVRPLLFLRELACVDSHYRPFTGRAARQRHCDHFKPLPGTGLSYHPYTLAGGPNISTPNPDDASIANMDRVTRTLNALRARGRLQHPLRIWITEFGFRSDPPDPFESPIRRIPDFMGESEWLAYRNPNVVSYDQYPLVDDRTAHSGFGGFQSGIRFSNGRPKPGVYHAFKYPFYIRRLSGSRVEIFGGVRGGAPGTVVQLQSRSGRRGRLATFGSVTLGPMGYFDRVFTLSGAAHRQYRFVSGRSSSNIQGPG
jgi:hypothetical protein